MRVAIASLLLLFVVLMLLACSGRGKVIAERIWPDGRSERVEAVTPPKAISPASVSAGQTGDNWSFHASSGSGQPRDNALSSLSSLPMVGVGLMVVGIGLLIAKTWFPIIPMEAGFGLAALGAALIAAPVLIDRYAWLLALGVGLVFVFLIGTTVWRMNLWDVKGRAGSGTSSTS